MDERSESARIGRRTVLAGLAGIGGVAALSNAPFGAARETTTAPAIAWKHEYSGGPREYDAGLTRVVPTADGGYALGGTGAPITETGAETEQFALVKAGADGAREWVAFANDDATSTAEISFFDLVQTDDGGFVLVGCATDPAESASDRVGGEVAEAAKVTADGTVAWVRRFDAFDENEDSDFDQGHSDDALLLTVTATADGGVVAGGTFEGSPWVLALDAAGQRRWERHYDTGFRVETIVPDGEGYRAVVGGRETNLALALDATGRVRERTALDGEDGIDYEETPYNHRFAFPADGGFAYTGRDRGRENMVLGRLDAGGTRQWRAEYDGPYEDTDFARGVVATTDGGFVLYGYMRAAYDGDHTPALVRTDGEGTERWRRLFDGVDASHAVDLVETPDGGYACLLGSRSNTLVKLDPDPELGGPTPADPTEEAPSTEAPTGTPDDTAETPDESTGTPGTGSGDEASDETEEGTTDEDRGECPI